MLLAIDIGNTNIVIGVFDSGKIVESWRLATRPDRTADEVGILLTHLFAHRQVPIPQVQGIVIASVVPALTGTMTDMAGRYFHRTPLVIESGQDETGMPVLYEHPSEIGADRIVNAVAAYDLYRSETARPIIVVDFGTATTFDAVSARGEYLGGIICPGVQISADALFERAARLPRVDVRKPASLIGRTTVEAMQSGLFFGYVAMIEGIVVRMRRRLTDDAADGRVVCVATGGLAHVISPETDVIDVVDVDLTLHGLRRVWDRANVRAAVQPGV